MRLGFEVAAGFTGVINVEICQLKVEINVPICRLPASALPNITSEYKDNLSVADSWAQSQLTVPTKQNGGARQRANSNDALWRINFDPACSCHRDWGTLSLDRALHYARDSTIYFPSCHLTPRASGQKTLLSSGFDLIYPLCVWPWITWALFPRILFNSSVSFYRVNLFFWPFRM